MIFVYLECVKCKCRWKRSPVDGSFSVEPGFTPAGCVCHVMAPEWGRRKPHYSKIVIWEGGSGVDAAERARYEMIAGEALAAYFDGTNIYHAVNPHVEIGALRILADDRDPPPELDTAINAILFNAGTTATRKGP